MVDQSCADEGLRELALFAGAGGGILGGHLLGWRTVCAVEWEPYAASVLVARQNDGILPPFPVWDDVQTFDGKPWQGCVDVVSGGFPCQDISVAGKGVGIGGARSGMWSHMARIVGEVRPRYVFVENSPALVTRGLGVVLGDLAALGYDCRWTVLGAADVGAPHQRDRIWIRAERRDFFSHAKHEWSRRREQQPQSIKEAVATYTNEHRRWIGSIQYEHRREAAANLGVDGAQEPLADPDSFWQLQQERRQQNCGRWIGNCSPEVADSYRSHGKRHECAERIIEKSANFDQPSWWQIEPSVGRVVDGVAARPHRLKAIGNGQVPAVAAAAWQLLAKGT